MKIRSLKDQGFLLRCCLSAELPKPALHCVCNNHPSTSPQLSGVQALEEYPALKGLQEAVAKRRRRRKGGQFYVQMCFVWETAWSPRAPQPTL